MNASNLLFAGVLAGTLSVATVGQAAVTAPCGDVQFGSNLNLGDDQVALATPLGFAFPKPGGGTTTSIGISSNGFVWLDGSTDPGCCNGHEIKFVTRGPSIAPLWLDLDPSVSGAVWFRPVPATGVLPAHAVVTWDGVREWGAPPSSPAMTFQLLLFADGSVTMRYDQLVHNEAYFGLAGITSGNGATMNPVDLSATTATPHDSGTLPSVHEWFYGGGPGTQTGFVDLAGLARTFVPNGQGGYVVTGHPSCISASASPFGQGCPKTSSFFELFPSGEVIDLANTAIEFTPQQDGGYLALQQGTMFTGYSNLVPLGTHDLTQQSLPFPFHFPGDTTTTLTVSTDGMVFLKPVGPFFFFADLPDFVSNVARIGVFSTLMDMASSPAGGIYYDVVGSSEVHITWVDVPCDGGGQVTCQLTLRSDDSFRLAWGNAPSLMSIDCLVGFSKGLGYFVPDELDLTATPFTTPGYGEPSVLRSSQSFPVVGATYVMDLFHAAPGSALCVMVLGATAFPAGIDLTSIGIDGCQLYVSPDVLIPFPIGGSSSLFSLPIPGQAGFVGLPIEAQAATLTPGVNPLGLLTSNGLHITCGF